MHLFSRNISKFIILEPSNPCQIWLKVANDLTMSYQQCGLVNPIPITNHAEKANSKTWWDPLISDEMRKVMMGGDAIL